MTVRIRYKNFAYIKIAGDPSIIMELSEQLKFMVPGYKFMPKYRQGLWDGSISLLNLRDQSIYAGLLPKVEKLLHDNEIPYTIESDPYFGMPGALQNINEDEVQTFMDDLNIQREGKAISHHDYQVEAVTECLQKRNVLIKSATSSGKSLIIYSMFRYLSEDDPKARTLVIVPTIGLVNQMFNDFKDYSTGNGYDVEKNVALQGGKHQNKDAKHASVIVSTWQSLQRLGSEYFNQFTCIIVDEAHKAAAAALTGMMEKATDVPYRLGFTGTLQDAKCHAYVLQGLFGPVHSAVTAKELIDRGLASDIKITGVVLKYPEEIAKAFAGKKDYDAEVKFLVSNERRNKFIRNLALQCEGTTLVLYRFVDLQGKKLYELIKEKSQDRDVYFISQETTPEERENIRTVVQKKPGIVVASMATTATGVNIPSIENILFGHPTKSKITVKQSIGRGLRKHEGKTHCKVWDIADDMSYKGKQNIGMRHFAERLTSYSEEGFKFSITNLNFQ